MNGPYSSTMEGRVMDTVVELERPYSEVGPKLRTAFAIRAFMELLEDLRYIPIDELESDFEVYHAFDRIKSCSGVDIAGICPIQAWGPVRIRRDFSNSRFQNLEFHGTDFSGSAFRGAEFTEISAYEIALNGVDARYTRWLRSSVLDSSIQSARFGRADLSGCNLSGCDLSNTSFRNIRAIGTNFGGARLHNCDFSFSDLRGARFSEAHLLNTDFSYALHISPEHLPPVDVGQANFWGVTRIDGVKPLEWPREPPPLKTRLLAILRAAGLWGHFEIAA